MVHKILLLSCYLLCLCESEILKLDLFINKCRLAIYILLVFFKFYILPESILHKTGNLQWSSQEEQSHLPIEAHLKAIKEELVPGFITSHSKIGLFGFITKAEEFFKFIKEDAGRSLWGLRSKLLPPVLQMGITVCLPGGHTEGISTERSAKVYCYHKWVTHYKQLCWGE